MNPTRRLFLQSAAMSAIAATLPPGLLAQSLNKPGRVFDPENLSIFDGVSASTFEPWIGSRFQVILENKSLGSIVLLSVNDPEAEPKDSWGTSTDSARATDLRSKVTKPSPTTSFSLIFEGSGAALPQDTYTLSHDWLGTFPLFLVPSGFTQGRPIYVAVFTLLNQPEAKKAE